VSARSIRTSRKKGAIERLYTAPPANSVVICLDESAIVGIIGIYDVQDISNRVNTFNANSTATASVGVGVYLMVIAAAILLIGAIWRFIGA
jgi:ABC-type amino acid transport system permease subunit